MRARVGIAALVVVSVGLLGCSGDDDPEGADGGSADGGGAAAIGDLELAELATLPFAVDAAVRVDQGLLVATGGTVQLLDAESGEPFVTATTTAGGPSTTVLPDGGGEVPRVTGLVAASDGTPYALLDGASCGVAEVDTSDLALGAPVLVDGVTCNDPVVLDDQLFLLSYDYAEGDVDPDSAVPQYTYRLGTVDLASGEAKAVDATSAVEGFTLPFGSGLVRVGDEIDLVLQKVDDSSTPYVIGVDDSLELGAPEARPDLDGYGERIAGEVFFGRPVVVDGREWAFRVSEAGQAATLAVFDGDGTDPLGEVALPEDLGATFLGDGAITLAADDDGAYLFVTSGEPDARTTKLYRVS